MPLAATKTVVRPLRFHERPTFVRAESAFDIAPWGSCVLGVNVSESLRVAATIARAADRAVLETQPFSWGYGATDGALAHNNSQFVVAAKRVAFFRHQTVRSVSAGNRLSLFLTADGRVYQSGRLFLEQDGCGMWSPRELHFELAGSRIVSVAAGHLTGYALDDAGRVYSWGTQQFGQLGFESEREDERDGQEPNESSDATAADVDKPPSRPDHDSRDDASASDISSEDDDECARGSTPAAVVVERAPKLILGLKAVRVTRVSAGNHFALATSSDGLVYSWGRDCYGQLGRGATDKRAAHSAVPTRIAALALLIAVDVCAGDAHALGVFVSRAHVVGTSEAWASPAADFTVVYAWGRGRRGCLGLGGSADEPRPREVRFFRGLNAARVAAGSDHSLVLCRAGTQSFVYAFGGNACGQLGVASADDHVDMPTLVAELAHVRVASVGAGARYSVALSGRWLGLGGGLVESDGELFTWGDATHGKTQRRDKRTTFVPWKAEASDMFVTEIAVDGETDRWRAVPLGPIVSCLQPVEGASPVCVCESSQSRTPSAFGVFVACATCGRAPICRLCARRCHIGHSLAPVALGRAANPSQQHSAGNLASAARLGPCAFAKMAPRIVEDEHTRASPGAKDPPTAPFPFPDDTTA
ncbi:hypothetical protein PybrP1_000916 [[Pythium] brassicae (nom. inval.)]|nr:hypothetical protein PybrP1_000916 [[Pythium] brassicae (nom. inval.)]